MLYFIKFVFSNYSVYFYLSFTQNVKIRNTTFPRSIKTQVHTVFKKYVLMIEFDLSVWFK